MTSGARQHKSACSTPPHWVLHTAIGTAILAGVLRTANWLYTAPRQYGGGNKPYAVAGRSTR